MTTAATAGIGDINGSALGGAARYNAGKPAMELLPLPVVAMFYDQQPNDTEAAAAAARCLGHLSEFQNGGDVRCLIEAMHALGDRWEECADVLDFGRGKYVAWNWSRGMPWSATIASCARHLLAIIRGQHLDPESHLPHRGHAFCNLVFLATWTRTYVEGDDRPPAGRV